MENEKDASTELKVFLESISRLPFERQIEVLRKTTEEITKMLADKPTPCAYCPNPATYLGVCDKCNSERVRLAEKAAGELR